MKEQKHEIGELEIGMYVNRLDRPWLETPFLFQGFWLSTQDDIDALSKYCDFVYVDVERDPMETGGLSLEGEPTVGESPAKQEDSSADFQLTKIIDYEDTTTLEEEISAARDSKAQLEADIFDVMEQVRQEKPLQIDILRKSTNQMIESVTRNPDAYFWLLRLKQSDSYTYRHSVYSSVLVTAFGRHLGLRKPDIANLALGTMLFDIGKLKLPSTLLNKPGRLTEEEFEQIKKHVPLGVDILRGTPGVKPVVIEIVANHHERHNGSGYPLGLKGNSIPLFARMAAIVDCFTAVTSQRPYGGPITAHYAIRDMYNWRDVEFQAPLLEQFIQCLGVYPTGSIVELSTGQVGMVYAQNRSRRLRPRIMLVLDSDKVAYDAFPVLDLVHDTVDDNGAPIEIVGTLKEGDYGIDSSLFTL